LPCALSDTATPSAFLLAVETLSGKISVQPMKDHSAKSWEAAISRILEESAISDIRCFLSDRDSVATSPAFRRTLLKKYAVSWLYLRSRGKAYAAENQIRYVKQAISMAMLAHPDEKDWTKFVPGIVAHHNSGFIGNTDIRRKSVNKHTYMSVLETLYKSESPDLLINVASSENFSPEMGKFLWRYDVGQEVLLRVGSLYSEKRPPFYKPSAKGSFSRRSYVIAKRVLKSSGDFFLCPLYRLRGVKGLAYEVDLLPVDFQHDAAAADQGDDGGGTGQRDLPRVEREGRR
jgi:hypothetical protein